MGVKKKKQNCFTYTNIVTRINDNEIRKYYGVEYSCKLGLRSPRNVDLISYYRYIVGLQSNAGVRRILFGTFISDPEPHHLASSGVRRCSHIVFDNTRRRRFVILHIYALSYNIVSSFLCFEFR